MKKTTILRLLVLPVLVAVAFTGLACNKMGGSATTVEAEEFLLKDSDGNVRAVIGFSDDYQTEPGIYLMDENGDVRISLAVLEEGYPGIAIFDKAGEVRTLLDIDEDESPGIYFYDPDGNLRAMMTVFDDGVPDLTFFDEYGEIVWGSP